MIRPYRISIATLATLLLLVLLPFGATAQENTWLKRIGGEEENLVTSLLRNNAGELYMTGSFIHGNGRFPIGHITLVSEAPANFRAGFIAKLDAEGQVIWAQVLRSNRFGSFEEAVLDEAGNMYVIGRFHGELTFMDQTYTQNSYFPQHFLAKYDAAGTPLWLRFLPGETTVDGKLAIDKQGNLYLACAQGTYLGSAVETRGLYLYKFDNDGALLSERLITPVSSSHPAYVRSLLVDANQQPIVAGEFLNSVQIEEHRFEERSMANGFLVKYRADGSLLWATHVGKGERFTSILDMTFDSAENIYLTGRFANKSDQMDLALKFNPAGEQTQRFSVTRNVDTFYMGGLYGSTIKVSEKDQSIVVAGQFRQRVAFGSTVLDSQREETHHDVFLTKIKATGEITGAIQSTGNGTSSAINLVLTPTDRFYLAGHTISSTFRFPQRVADKPVLNWDIFLYKEHLNMLDTPDQTQPDPEEEPEPIVYEPVIIPNIFTPNGDAKNQFFEIVHLDLSQNNSLVVFNRWGKQVYHARSYQNNWEAAGLADGTYYYVLYLERENKYVKGWVDVVR